MTFCPWCGSALGAGNRQCATCERCERCGCWCGPKSWHAMVPVAVVSGIVLLVLYGIVCAVWQLVTG